MQMPFVSNTPESLLPRSDSKNPNVTCRGITLAGRPCRRALAVPKSLSGPPRKLSSIPTLNDVVALGGEDVSTLEAFYCWQHKDQATQELSSNPKKNQTTLTPLRERSSIDTLCDRLQVIDIEDGGKRAAKPNRENLPLNLKSKTQQGPKSSRRKAGFLEMLCCSTKSDGDDYVEIVRHRQRISRTPRPDVDNCPKYLPRCYSEPHLQLAASPDSQTRNMLSMIPSSLSAKTTSALLNEISKPVSKFDEEGYIYIFWLTDGQRSAPDSILASELLVTAPSTRTRNDRRQSDVLAQYASTDVDSPSGQHSTILLKVGRANNVHRRMKEWSRQCGYNLSLVRFYPYVPTLSSVAQEGHAMSHIRKVPYSHRVERLVHIELAEKQIKQPRCESCGRQHREWFEIEATRAGLKQVDEVVKRWIAWAESTRSGAS